MPFLYSFKDETTGAKWDYKSPTQLSPEEQDALASKAKVTGVFDKHADEAQEVHRADLETNPALKDAVRTWYRAENGTDFKGDDPALITEYYRQMRDYEANITKLGTLSARLLSGTRYDNKSRESLALMWNTWDKVVPFYEEEGKKWAGAFEAVKDYGVSSLQDPTNYLEAIKPVAGAFFGFGVGGVAGGAAAIAEKTAARTALRAAVKYQIKGGLRKAFAGHMVAKELAKGAMVQGGKSAAKEAVIFNSLGNIAEQTAKESLGAQEGFNIGEFAMNAGTSALVGGALGGTMGAMKYPMHGVTSSFKDSGVYKSVINSPRYAQFFGKYGKEADNIVVAQQNEGHRAIAAREADVMNKYRALTEDARADTHGAERKAIRDEHYGVFRDRLAEHMGKGKEDTFFGNNSIGFDDVVKSEEVLQSIYSSAGILPEDNIHVITNKILDMDAGTVVNSSQTINGKVLNLTGHQQQNVTLIALENHFFNNLHVSGKVKDPSVNAIENMDSFLRIAQRNNESASASGWNLNMNKNRFKITDDLVGTFRNLTPTEKVVSTDRASKFETPSDALHFMSEMTKINALYNASGGTNTGVDLALKRGIVKSAGWIEDTFKSAIMNKPSVAAYNLTTSLAHSLTMPMEELFTGLKTGNKKLTSTALHQLAYPITQFHDLQQSFMYGARAFLTARSAFTDRSLGDMTSRDMLSKDFDLRRIHKFGLTNRKAWMTSGETDPIGNVHLGFRFLGNGVKVFSKRMGIGGDELVQVAAFRSKAYGIAVVEELSRGVEKSVAIKNALQRTDDAMRSQVVAHMRGGMSDDPLAKIAMDEALDATWKTDLQSGFDVGAIGKYVQGLKTPNYKTTDTVGKVWRKAYGSLAVELLIPFIRTPANLLNYTFEHTPYLSMASKKFRTAMQSADPAIREAAQSKVAMGSAFWAIALYQALSGDIQGGGAGNFNQKKVQGGGDDEGNRRVKYSMNIGDGKRIPFSRLDPLFTAHKIMADVIDVARYGTPQDAIGLVGSLVLQFSDMFGSMPTLQSVAATSNLLKVITADPAQVSEDRKWKAAEKYVAGFVNPLVPTYWVASVLRECLGDSGMEEAVSITDAVKRDIGMVAEKVGFGYNTGLNRIFDPLLSVQMDKDAWNPLFAHQEDSKLNDVLNDMDMPAPSNLKNNGKVNLSKAMHTDSGRSYYDLLQHTTGTIRLDENSARDGYEKFMVGKNLKEALQAFSDSPEFANASSLGEPITKFQSGKVARREYPQQTIIRNIIEWYRGRADVVVLREAERLMNSGDEEATKVFTSWTAR